ncbi:Putative NAD(P)-binding domain, NAD(P)-binding domain superfamily [Colletotrichum destructivum]|uniref:NAD(P)-binding domain, NAD(P)-binding domain superfamily n=1 Tax=Colletotrichum destructivum TaxID=34406 RepID=A0AAX4ILJ3_9PEZI|nr:Putative NAD(P)-binding domain, NAD(P)-binding domain superfamily [Colletotrichum destructivum]
MAEGFAKDAPQGFRNYVKNVAIVGAGGNIGRALAEQLLKTGKHTVTAITRTDSTSSPPHGVKIASVNYQNHDSLVAALKGQDFLIITLSLSAAPGTHTSLVRAAAEAGVPYVMPNAYSINVHSEGIQRDVPIAKVVLENIAEVQKAGLKSVTLINGFWYEYSLVAGPSTFGFDLKSRTVTLYDDGRKAIDISTWAQCGRAVASLLSQKILPEDDNDRSTTISQFDNKTVFVSSFRVSQRDILDSVMRVTGTADSDWKLEHENSEKRYKDGVDELNQGKQDGFLKMLYARVFQPSGDADFESDNDLLGLPVEDLDEATRKALLV